MNKLNLLVYLNAYADANPSNAPSRNNFKWTRDVNSIFVNNPNSLEFDLAPGESRTLINGMRTLTQDGTTQYSIALAPIAGQTTTWQLTWSGGTNPGFRTSRNSGANASTQVTVTQNGTVLTFSSTGGTPFNLISGGVVVGDFVQIGNLFNIVNQGQYQIVSLTATSFSIVNAFGTAEGPYTLGSGYASQIDIFSAAGVQAGDTLLITGGFSPVTQGSYVVSAVTDLWVQFSFTGTLPTQGPITTEDIVFYFDAQRMIYLESNQQVSMVLNDSEANVLNPLIGVCGCVTMGTGIFMTTSIVYSMVVTNTSLSTAKLFLASVQ
jgi:hypothetical protein